jgi:epoxyqueuosine reductase
MYSNTSKNTTTFKNLALELGFSSIGFSKAEKMNPEAKRLDDWLNKGSHGDMHYMSNYYEKRIDPRKLVEDAKSVVSLSFNYFTPIKQKDIEAPKVSTYAYGRDYHKVIKKKLKTFINRAQEVIGNIQGRAFVDSAPVMERDWAVRSGLGWMGKNTLLINPKKGSYFFLAEIICDLEFEYDQPIKDYCGTCTRCIDACPTGAFSKNGYQLEAKKCISYLTIELKTKIPEVFQGQMGNYIFGCDICQQVCPWNRFSTPHNELDFQPKGTLINMRKSDWIELTEEVFDQLFQGSAVKRTKFEGLKRNIDFVYRDLK